jgi:hypothetical protein
MSNALVKPATDFASTAITASQLKAQIQVIQRAMADVMFDGEHYGKIPGTPKPTLFKAGAEKLCLLFHIAPMYRTEDLSTHDVARYRVTCLGKSQVSGLELGEGLGEASTNEAKYKWREPVCDAEYDATDESMRRVKWFKGQPPYSKKQIRTEPADTANTVLKMAAKRALVAMVLNVLAASDIFAQDLEDLDDVPGEGNEGRKPKQPNKPATTPPRSTGAQGGGKITEAQKRLIFAKLNDAGMEKETLTKRFNVESVNDIPFAKVNEVLAFIADPDRDTMNAPDDEQGRDQ